MSLRCGELQFGRIYKHFEREIVDVRARVFGFDWPSLVQSLGLSRLEHLSLVLEGERSVNCRRRQAQFAHKLTEASGSHCPCDWLARVGLATVGALYRGV